MSTGCLPGVHPGGMAPPQYNMYDRREFRNAEGVTVLSGRLCEWGDSSQVKVDQVKLVAGIDVPTRFFTVQLPPPSLAKLVVAPLGTTVKEQFGLSLDAEYGIPPGVDFRTSLCIGDRRNPRKGESCVRGATHLTNDSNVRCRTLRRLRRSRSGTKGNRSATTFTRIDIEQAWRRPTSRRQCFRRHQEESRS